MASKAKVSIFATCVVNHIYPNVGMSVSNVLNKLGISTTVEVTQVCCGQPFFNSGYWSDARKLGKKFLELYNSVEDDIVIPSGSCTSMIRNHYPDLFEEDDDLLTIIDDVNSRIYEFTEYVSCILEYDDRKLDVEKKFSGQTPKVTYHEACHLSRELGIKEEPRKLLNLVDGVEFIEMPKSEVCCGFGGLFSIKFPDISSAMMNEKIDSIRSVDCEFVTSSDSSCLMNIGGGLEKNNIPTKPMHIAEILDKFMLSEEANEASN